MFWKCLPIATSVSCIPNMLDNENRGVLLEMILDTDIKKIEKIINNEELYNKMNDNAMHWSRKYTIDYFEHEIKKILAK